MVHQLIQLSSIGTTRFMIHKDLWQNCKFRKGGSYYLWDKRSNGCRSMEGVSSNWAIKVVDFDHDLDSFATCRSWTIYIINPHKFISCIWSKSIITIHIMWITIITNETHMPSWTPLDWAKLFHPFNYSNKDISLGLSNSSYCLL